MFSMPLKQSIAHVILRVDICLRGHVGMGSKVSSTVFRQKAIVCSKTYVGPQVIKLFSCSTLLSMKFSLLINKEMSTIVGFFIFVSRKMFMFVLFSMKEFTIDSNLRLISRTNFMLSC